MSIYTLAIVNLVLNLVTLLVVVGSLTTITRVFSRQRRDLADNKRVLRAVAQLSVAMERDNRKTRHAVRNIAAALDMRSIAESLNELPVFDEPAKEAILVDRIIAAGEKEEEHG